MLLLALVAIISSAPASADWAKWQDARALYDAGKYTEALAAFQSQASEDYPYYYNVGAVSYRLSRFGNAVAYLEKANRLHPRDPEIQHNLELARGALGQAIGKEHLDPASSWIEATADQISLDEVRSFLGLLGVIVVALWIRAYLKTRSLRHVLSQPAGLIGIMGFAITAALYAAQRSAATHPPAVCLERQIVRSGPGDRFVELGQVESGTKLRLLGSQVTQETPAQGSTTAPTPETWSQVRFSPDSVGWVRGSALLPL